MSNTAAAETEKVRRDESRSTPAPAPPPRCRRAHVAGDEEWLKHCAAAAAAAAAEAICAAFRRRAAATSKKRGRGDGSDFRGA